MLFESFKNCTEGVLHATTQQKPSKMKQNVKKNKNSRKSEYE